MSSTGDSRVGQRLRTLPPTFTYAEARAAGLSPRDLSALLAQEEIHEPSRGVYRLASAPESAHLDLLAVARRAPYAVVCGESALALHELIDDIPTAVHIAVPRGAHRPHITYPPTIVSQYRAETFSVGVELFQAAPGETVPVYGAARSVVDAMRLRHRFGESLALSALSRYVRRQEPGHLTELQRIADDLDILPMIRPTIQAMLA
jgi:predicted transcriptional regulator of viral defense system